jgi:hypothetical protein
VASVGILTPARTFAPEATPMSPSTFTGDDRATMVGFTARHDRFTRSFRCHR